jgi:molybdopterin synthase catalytic subunit
MSVEVIITDGALNAAPEWRPLGAGAVVSFAGVVRPLEDGQPIAGLRYEMYEPMAQQELERLAQRASEQFGVLSVRVEHSRGFVAAHECSFRLQVGAAHRQAALEAAAWFIDAMKRDVPIWKRAVIADRPESSQDRGPSTGGASQHE